VELIEHNRQRFHLTNLFVTEGSAPEVLEHLPVPTRVFIGGSGGKLKEIVAAALDKNPAARFVVTAITLETLTEALEVIRHYGFRETELVQVSVSKAHEVGRYHMMKAENPIYLISMEKPS
jgi:precorrin-6Y C5,15-methyltransferase (decarboxylating)